MKSQLKSTLTAMLLSSVALVPAAAVSVLVTADAAYAKSDNAGGGGKGGGNGGGKGKSGDKKGGKSSKSAKSNGSSGKSLGSTKAGKRVEGLFKKITGQDKKVAKVSRTSPSKAKIAKTDLMHPSNLGNMNGAMNASINAVLAHVRNGNTNGPVGHLAALAVANENAAGAQDIIDLDMQFATLDDLLTAGGYESLQDYFDDRNGIGPDESIEQAIADLDGLAEGDPGYAEAVVALDTALGDYPTVDDYYTARDGDGGSGDIDVALDAVGGDPVAGTEPLLERPDEDIVADAETDLQAQSDAEQSILSYWNKNEDTSEEITGDEQMLLDALNDRLIGEEDAIRDAMGEPEGEAASCEIEEGCDGVLDDEEVVLIVE